MARTDEQYRADREKSDKRIKHVLIIGGVSCTLSDDTTKLTLQIGKEKVEWDFWDFEAFADSYQIRPKKPEDVVLDVLKERA